MKESDGSRGRQPGNLTLLRPPPASVRGGEWEEKGGMANDGNLKRFPFSSLDSYSPDIFHSSSTSPTPPHIYYCTFCYLLDTVSPTDWLIDWLSHFTVTLTPLIFHYLLTHWHPLCLLLPWETVEQVEPTALLSEIFLVQPIMYIHNTNVCR